MDLTATSFRLKWNLWPTPHTDFLCSPFVSLEHRSFNLSSFAQNAISTDFKMPFFAVWWHRTQSSVLLTADAQVFACTYRDTLALNLSTSSSVRTENATKNRQQQKCRWQWMKENWVERQNEQRNTYKKKLISNDDDVVFCTVSLNKYLSKHSTE